MQATDADVAKNAESHRYGWGEIDASMQLQTKSDFEWSRESRSEEGAYLVTGILNLATEITELDSQ